MHMSALTNVQSGPFLPSVFAELMNFSAAQGRLQDSRKSAIPNDVRDTAISILKQPDVLNSQLNIGLDWGREFASERDADFPARRDVAHCAKRAQRPEEAVADADSTVQNAQLGRNLGCVDFHRHFLDVRIHACVPSLLPTSGDPLMHICRRQARPRCHRHVRLLCHPRDVLHFFPGAHHRLHCVC